MRFSVKDGGFTAGQGIQLVIPGRAADSSQAEPESVWRIIMGPAETDSGSRCARPD
jgi:hypothetical protein